MKLTLKYNAKEGTTENHTETIPLLFRNAKNVNLPHFLPELNTVSYSKPFINYIKSLIITMKI